MACTELVITTNTLYAELISQLLWDAGSSGVVIEDKYDVALNARPEGQWDILDPAIAEALGDDVRVKGYYDAETVDAAEREIREKLRLLRAEDPDADMGPLGFSTSPVAEQDWSESWKAGLKPVRLGDHIVVRAGWMDGALQPGDIPIEIDPGLAFGTGTHETTAMCAGLIERWLRPGMTVTDIGTGSGILAIAAAKLGASRVLATDLDAVAARVAAENAEINKVSDRMDVRCGDLLDVVDAPADLVVVNIIADVIIRLAAPVAPYVKPGGLLICSGIQLERRADVERALIAAGYELLDAPVRGEWAAFCARRP